jgi:hypothetical protein
MPLVFAIVPRRCRSVLEEFRALLNAFLERGCLGQIGGNFYREFGNAFIFRKIAPIFNSLPARLLFHWG